MIIVLNLKCVLSVICNTLKGIIMLLKKRIQQAYFFRARKFDCLENLQKWNQTDFDSRKAYKIHNYGRLNKPYEEMMYFCNKPEQTLEEIDYEHKTPVVISAYKVKQNFSCVDIVVSSEENNDDRIPWLKLRGAFSQRETPELNKFTTKIREQFYTVPIDNAQGWVYPTVGKQSKDKFNLAMYPGVAKHLLEFQGAIVISKANPNGMKKIEFCFDRDYRLDYIKGYPELQKIFNLD